MTFWDLPTFHEYERLCGDEPGTRARLLASAEFNTRVVDLSQSEAELWQGVRRSYRSLIHAAEHRFKRSRGVDNLSTRCGPEHTGSFILLNSRQVHKTVAGRETRLGETWGLMGLWIDSGHALLSFAQEWREPFILDAPPALAAPLDQIGYAYCVIYGSWSYYFSSATLEKNVNHALLWHAMKALKSRGVRYFELGWQGEAHDVKGKNIEYFRRGFGGSDIPAKEAPALCGR